MRMVAIHNRALTPTQIMQNFEAGVGEKYFMLFNVSHLVSVPQAYVMLEAQQLDNYGLQFAKPTFISLDPNASVADLQIEGIRVGVNGLEARAGQAYVPLKASVGGAGYTAGAGQLLTEVGTVIGLEMGVTQDLFFLSFERIGANSNPHAPLPVPDLPEPADLAATSDVGLKTFDEINTTLSQITGVPMTNARVAATYDLVKQALPAVEQLGTFGPAQQTAMAQLAIQYCNQMVETPALRTAFFGNTLNPAATATASFGSSGAPNAVNRDIVVDALMNKGKNTALGNDQLVLPGMTMSVDDHVQAEIDDLIDKLVTGPTGAATNGTATVMKATCGAVLGSAVTLMQ
jgi:hypothetical protein